LRELTFTLAIRFRVIFWKILKKKPFPCHRYPQSRAAIFRTDLHRFCLRQSQGPARVEPRLDEFFSALRIAAGAVIRHHVEDAVCRTQQPAVSDRTTLGTVTAFVLAMLAGSVITLTSVMWLIHSGWLVFP
jgi:hypothetical protein